MINYQELKRESSINYKNNKTTKSLIIILKKYRKEKNSFYKNFIKQKLLVSSNPVVFLREIEQLFK